MRRRPRAPQLTALALLAGLPVVTGLGFAQGSAERDGTTPAASTATIVAESVATARNVIPFGVSRTGAASIVWATGSTREQSVQQPGPDPPAIVSSTPDDTSGALTPTKGQSDGIVGRGAKDDPTATPTPSSPPFFLHSTVLLDGLAATSSASTVWQRSPAPLDTDDTPIDGLAWRPAGGAAAANAGAATPSGAAAMLITIGGEGDPNGRAAIMARRASDGRFQVIPDPSAALLSPATQTFNNAQQGARLPFAVVDGAAPTTPAATPTPTVEPTPATTPPPTSFVPSSTTGTVQVSTPPIGAPGLTTPPAPTAQTGVLIAPPGGDGVLAWDGAAWHKEPYLDAAGAPLTAGITPIALAATPAGDGVALVQNSDTSTLRDFHLYRRTADHRAWREVAISGSGLLTGTLPSGVQSVTAVPSPGTPLTVTDGHWWIDLIVTPTGNGEPSTATVHLVPGALPTTPTTPTTPATSPGDTPAPSPAASPEPAATSTTPASTDTPTPTASATPQTSPAGTTVPAATDLPTPTASPAPPSTTPPLTADADAVWCHPSVAGCTRELEGTLAILRGYRSFAFPGKGFGGRIITSPDIAAAGSVAARQASASGGYLKLQSDNQFRVQSGVGDDGTTGSEAQSAAFASPTLGWIGGERAVGHVRVAGDGTVPELADGATDSPDALIAVAASPPGLPPELSGAIAITASQSLRRQMGDEPWQWSSNSINIDSPRGQPTPSSRSIAWPTPNMIAIAGTEGMLLTGPPPLPDGPGGSGPTSSQSQLQQVPGTNGLDFLSVGFSPDGSDGWAVGRSGAAMHYARGQWARVVLAPALLNADLRKIAYAGPQPLIASTAGLLVPDGGRFAVDTGLAALLRADGRGPGVQTVAGLPSGVAVVDARYIRDSATSPWRRLASPAEGDVLDSALASGPTVTEPIVLASISDSIPDRRGPQPDTDPTLPLGADRGNPFEIAPKVADGRLEQLGPAGWTDRDVLPMEDSVGRDLAFGSRDVAAVAARPDGTAFAVGGSGTYANFLTSVSAPRGYAVAFDTDPSAPPVITNATELSQNNSADLILNKDGPEPVAAQGIARRATAARADDLAAADTTPLTPVGQAADPSISTGSSDAVAGAAPVRLLIGGHPACIDECAGRDDQRVGPTATLVQALQTAARMKAVGDQGLTPPVAGLVIGGGRASVGGAPLSVAGADDYADLLHSVPGTPPILPAIGTGDASTADGRTNFVNRVLDPLAPPHDPQVTDAPPARESDAWQSYAADPLSAAYYTDFVAQSRIPVRLIVVDNTAGLRDDHERAWLTAAIADASGADEAVIVVGGPRLDDHSTLPDAELISERTLMVDAGATAYVGTDGADDPNDISTFGPRASDTTVSVNGRTLEVIHSAALGHFLPFPVQFRRTLAVNSAADEASLRDALAGATGEPELVALDIRPNPTIGSQPYVVDVSTVPVFRTFGVPTAVSVPTGSAQLMYAATLIDADNGLKWADPTSTPGTLTPTTGFGTGDATPDQCRLFEPASLCGTSLPTDATFSVADPNVAVFVRAKAGKISGTGKNRSAPAPQIVLDKDGNPIIDAHSPVLCPLAPGNTTFTMTTGGQSVTVPLSVITTGSAPTTTAGTTDSRAPCSFFFGHVDTAAAAPKAATQPAPVAPVPAPPVAPAKPTVHHHPVPPLLPAPIQGPTLVAPPVNRFHLLPQMATKPPVAPNPKPITGPVPAPPTGISPQQVPQQVQSPNVQGQVQIQSMVAAVQEQARRQEVARESVDHRAVIYRHPSRPDLVVPLTGALLALLFASFGAIAGRRRAAARSLAKAWIR